MNSKTTINPEKLQLQRDLESTRNDAAALLAELKHAAAHTATEVQVRIAELERLLNAAENDLQNSANGALQSPDEVRAGLKQAWKEFQTAGERALQSHRIFGSPDLY